MQNAVVLLLYKLVIKIKCLSKSCLCPQKDKVMRNGELDFAKEKLGFKEIGFIYVYVFMMK